MASPENDIELKYIKRTVTALMDELKKGTEEVVQTEVKTYASQKAEAEKDLIKQAKDAAEQLTKDIAKLEAKGQLKTQEEIAKYGNARLQEQQKAKLQSEIETLQYISKANEEERKKQTSYLEAEKEILKLRNNGNEKEAKQKEKELEKQKKEDKRKEKRKEADSQSFGDLIKSNFQELQEERDIGFKNAAKKTGAEDLVKVMKGVGKAITDGLNAINTAISNYAKYQTAINSRLQGVSSYSEVANKLSDVAFSPLLKAEDLYSNVSDLVAQGIVTNLEQRAMFATVKDGIASTFEVTNDSLKRLIRIQQNDSTAARLGMEAYLTKFLNVYVENTEYLQSTFDSVSSSLLEASSMMYLSNKNNGAAASAELEFVIQKWLGTLSGVGLSDEAAQNIANAIGQLGSGDIDSLGSSEIQNLIVMAASKVGLSYGEMLNSGLTAGKANDLMFGVVNYLQEVAETGTNVVKSQLAKVFGVTVSDLVAVSNLSKESLTTVHNDLLSYGNMYGELQEQFDELPGRLGISNILENLFSNLTYQTGMSIGSNPATYALWKITDMIQGVTGGINIPYISAMGNGIGLETTVENLMKLGIVGISTLGNIGKIIGGLGSIGNGSVLLNKLKVSQDGAEVKSFGGANLGGKKRKSGKTTSENTYVGNSDSDSYYNSTLNAANDEQEKKLNAKLEEYDDPVVKYFKEDLQYKELLDKYDEKLNAISANVSLLAGFKAAINGGGENTGAASLLDIINTNSTAIITEITTLNGTVTSGVETLNKTLSEALDKYTVLNNSYSEINGNITNQVQEIQNALPNNGTNNSSIQGVTEYDKYQLDQGIINNNSTSISTTNSDISSYLVDIDFSSGFKILVDNVTKIRSLLEDDTFSSNASETDITGFTQNQPRQYTFNE